MSDIDIVTGLSGGKLAKKKSIFGVTQALNAGTPHDYRKIRCKGDEAASSTTKTYSLGLAAEQVPATDEFGVECLENLQIIEDDAQATQVEKTEYGTGRRAMSDWLVKYGDITGNASKKSVSPSPFGVHTGLFSQLVQEANSLSKTSETSESNGPAVVQRKKTSSKSDGKTSAQGKKNSRPKKAQKKPEKVDGKHITT